MTAAVLAAHAWPTNAALIADVARLWYRPGDRVADVTHGRGLWWTTFRPTGLVAHDLHRGDGVDFRQLPEPEASFDVVAFDPPYKPQGGKPTDPGVAEMNDRYGIDPLDAGRRMARTPGEMRAINAAGLVDIRRVLRPGGLCWAKCMDFVWSGRKVQGVRWMLEDAEAAGFELVEQFVHVGGPGPQPKSNLDGSPRRQVHARTNYSVLLVLRAVPAR